MEKTRRYLDGNLGKNGAQHLPQEEVVACPHAQKVSQKFDPAYIMTKILLLNLCF